MTDTTDQAQALAEVEREYPGGKRGRRNWRAWSTPAGP